MKNQLLKSWVFHKIINALIQMLLLTYFSKCSVFGRRQDAHLEYQWELTIFSEPLCCCFLEWKSINHDHRGAIYEWPLRWQLCCGCCYFSQSCTSLAVIGLSQHFSFCTISLEVFFSWFLFQTAWHLPLLLARRQTPSATNLSTIQQYIFVAKNASVNWDEKKSDDGALRHVILGHGCHTQCFKLYERYGQFASQSTHDHFHKKYGSSNQTIGWMQHKTRFNVHSWVNSSETSWKRNVALIHWLCGIQKANG